MLASSTFADHLASRCQLAAVGVAAAWRQGHWQLLRRYLSLLEAAGAGSGTQSGSSFLQVGPVGRRAPWGHCICLSCAYAHGPTGAQQLGAVIQVPLTASDAWEVCIGSVLEALHAGNEQEVGYDVSWMRATTIHPALYVGLCRNAPILTGPTGCMWTLQCKRISYGSAACAGSRELWTGLPCASQAAHAARGGRCGRHPPTGKQHCDFRDCLGRVGAQVDSFAVVHASHIPRSGFPQNDAFHPLSGFRIPHLVRWSAAGSFDGRSV